ncbi:thermonuclease family protein [Azospira oryzae]|nr:thermonuclease family protein [Azospira oryzae]
MGIDAPEKSQAFGTRSKQSLSALVFGKQVAVEFYKKDRYGRLIAKIATPNTPDANLEQVKRGMAWHYKDYQREQSPIDRETYANAEEEARAYRRGLWSDTDPVAPWAFRKAKRAGNALLAPSGR